MNIYILTLLSAALVAAVAELLSPKGEGGRTASHIRMVAGLFLLIALLEPLRAGVELLRNAVSGDLAARLEASLPAESPEDYGAILGDTLTAISRDEVETYVGMALERDFGIPPSGCTIAAICAYEDGTLTLQELRISLRGTHILQDPHPIEAYFTEKLNCPCFVTVG